MLMHRLFVPSALALSLLAGAALAQDTAPVAAQPGAKRGGTLTHLVALEPTCFDTYAQGNLINTSLADNFLDSLLSQAADGTLHPHLAESWDVSDDKTVYTFRLRKDVTFSDGTPFNAEAVKTNIERPTKPGGRLYALRFPFKHSEVLDEFTWRLTLERPYAPLLQNLATSHYGIISPKALAEHSQGQLCGNPQALVGTGPFVVDSYVKGVKLVFKRNEHYQWSAPVAHHQGPAYLDELVIRFVPEAQSRVGALLSGQADSIDQVPPINVPQLAGNARTAYILSPNTGIPYLLQLNPNLAPLDDARVRLALRSAIDVDGLLAATYRGLFQRAWTVLDPNTPPVGSYDASLEGSWKHDVSAANRLLDEAGWQQRDAQGYRVKDGKRLSLSWLLSPSILVQDQRQQLGEAIQSQWKAVGIEAVRTQVEAAAVESTLAKNQTHIADQSRGWGDSFYLHRILNAKNIVPRSNNWGHLDDDQLNAWTDELLVADDARRVALAHQIQRRVNDEAYVIPLYVVTRIIGRRDNVHGFRFNLGGYVASFHDVWIDDARR